MFKYNLIDKPNFNINKKTIDSIFENTSNITSIKQNWTLNIVFLDWNSIKILNKQYRQIDRVTDVLSFHYFEDFSELKSEDIAWEILMCEDKIKTQAIEFWLGEEKEFYKLLIHSLLHILWYDHEKDSDYKTMQALEDKISKEVFEK